MSKTKTKCCPKPFIIREIVVYQEDSGGGAPTYYELREDGGKELLEDESNELREY